jgi:hypothetical protein
VDNIYYYPDKFGLEQVEMIDYSSGDYCFDYRVIWRDKDGRLYTARDSGCSCPTPFERYTSVDALDPYDYESIRREAIEEGKHEWYAGKSVTDFIDRLPR